MKIALTIRRKQRPRYFEFALLIFRVRVAFIVGPVCTQPKVCGCRLFRIDALVGGVAHVSVRAKLDRELLRLIFWATILKRWQACTRLRRFNQYLRSYVTMFGDADLPQTVLTGVFVCCLATTGISHETVRSNADLPASATDMSSAPRNLG